MPERGDLTPFGEEFKEIAERRGMTLDEAIERTVAEAEADGLGDVVREEIGWFVYFCPEKYEKWRRNQGGQNSSLMDYL